MAEQRRLPVKCIRIGCSMAADKYDSECNPVCSSECADWLNGDDPRPADSHPVPIGSSMQPRSPFLWSEQRK